ncbi:MAG: hypothetical protein HF976_06270 [ANME-2 cluster archaeon]|nr:hypothetical protein [ANME-2 cluster archaeon]
MKKRLEILSDNPKIGKPLQNILKWLLIRCTGRAAGYNVYIKFRIA